MVLDMARPKIKKITISPGMRGRDAARKLTRFLRDSVYRESHLEIGWTEQKCKEWDEYAQEDHTYRLTPEERKRYKINGILP